MAAREHRLAEKRRAAGLISLLRIARLPAPVYSAPIAEAVPYIRLSSATAG
jgi:hypothetical protein